jgi:glutamine amidotransferase
MCQLLGLCFNQEVSPSLSFRGFIHRGDYNRDGWGLAYYPDQSALVIKEPLQSNKSLLANFFRDYGIIKSKIIISHVRAASIGNISYMNTHPFHRELGGKEFVFAHNGTLFDYTNLDTGRFKPIGDTDSEHVFCYLLNKIQKENINIYNWNQESFNYIYEILKEINQYGYFNCLFSDGEYLFAYHDKNNYNGLYYLERKYPFNIVNLVDEDFEIDLSKEKDPNQRGFIKNCSLKPRIYDTGI